MTTEMDLLHMDERQRLAWLMANRGTLITVGAAWVGLIVWELAHTRLPLFLIVMVPVFALLRVGLFFYYCSTPLDLEGHSGGRGPGRALKIGVAALLALALFLPLYSHGAPSSDEEIRYTSSWQVVQEGWQESILIPLAFLWPVAMLALSRKSSRSRTLLVVQVAEPVLAALSVLIVLWIPQFAWEPKTFLVFFIGVESGIPALGCYVAVVANGLYFVVWLSEALRSRATGSLQAA